MEITSASSSTLSGLLRSLGVQDTLPDQFVNVVLDGPDVMDVGQDDGLDSLMGRSVDSGWVSVGDALSWPWS
ncbi:hypothetical protein [Nesterenkonia sp. HG001]|uniref:hypothetical protein n=1 Tax=Nesterenkonia sp. HG001 TaxID=2983207 RepID=UPI002AC3F4DE|nr:hypothetical protein [Nesterenkonia sp. HG001]MDZ5078477.1 hypothetical protein [Nesterenkonia sp. HG001]